MIDEVMVYLAFLGHDSMVICDTNTLQCTVGSYCEVVFSISCWVIYLYLSEMVLYVV